MAFMGFLKSAMEKNEIRVSGVRSHSRPVGRSHSRTSDCAALRDFGRRGTQRCSCPPPGGLLLYLTALSATPSFVGTHCWRSWAFLEAIKFLRNRPSKRKGRRGEVRNSGQHRYPTPTSGRLPIISKGCEGVKVRQKVIRPKELSA